MARIAGVNLPKEKRVEIGLTTIYGIGKNLSNRILKEVNIDPNIKINDLNENQLAILREKIEKMAVEGDLRRRVQMDVKRLQEVGSYRGFRHRKGLPVRGQQTKTNARTRKGKRKTVANKKIATK
ncbi:30S ribosomal protein S13 [Patescibacteria group bacterium]|nr:30S ribosomal protein S13 [Patescibacteria group bacterium]MBU1703529.1 30S ribosomal protein S13 [Patescibacteria group bacterium]MBU1953436.1 30S ribosomal protein S13 [Patescibacteria group bacterium]